MMIQRAMFQKSVGIEARNVELNAYGSEEKDPPVISGSVPVTGWQLYKDNIYVARTEAVLGYLFVNNALMTIARYPDTGWLRTNSWQDSSGGGQRGAALQSGSQPGTIITCPEIAGHPGNAEDSGSAPISAGVTIAGDPKTRKVIAYDPAEGCSLDDRSSSVKGPAAVRKAGLPEQQARKSSTLRANGSSTPTKNAFIFVLPTAKIPTHFLVAKAPVFEGA